MKHIPLLSILLCVIALPTLADLTPQDLDKIDSIVEDSEKQMKEHINLKVEGVEKQITLLTNVVYGPSHLSLQP